MFGLGEAGAAISADLVHAGVGVVGWDPQPKAIPEGVRMASDPASAVAGAELILVLTSPGASLELASGLRPHLRTGQVYADCNSTSPSVKRQAAALLEPTGALFVDVALMAPVPGRGLRTPALASGPGAHRLADALQPLGMPVQVVGPGVGEAAGRKLVRSVFMKGLAAAMLEALEAARALGCEQELYQDIARTLEEADEELARRLLKGTRRHAARRVEEMHAACQLLEELGVPPRVSAAALAWLRVLSGQS